MQFKGKLIDGMPKGNREYFFKDTLVGTYDMFHFEDSITRTKLAYPSKYVYQEREGFIFSAIGAVDSISMTATEYIILQEFYLDEDTPTVESCICGFCDLRL